MKLPQNILIQWCKREANSQDTKNLRSTLLELHSKLQYGVKDKLTNVLAPMLQIPAPKKYQCWFALLLDPWYVMETTDINTFHQGDNVDTITLFQKMITKFYEYIMAA